MPYISPNYFAESIYNWRDRIDPPLVSHHASKVRPTRKAIRTAVTRTTKRDASKLKSSATDVLFKSDAGKLKGPRQQPSVCITPSSTATSVTAAALLTNASNVVQTSSPPRTAVTANTHPPVATTSAHSHFLYKSRFHEKVAREASAHKRPCATFGHPVKPTIDPKLYLRSHSIRQRVQPLKQVASRVASSREHYRASLEESCKKPSLPHLRRSSDAKQQQPADDRKNEPATTGKSDGKAEPDVKSVPSNNKTPVRTATSKYPTVGESKRNQVQRQLQTPDAVRLREQQNRNAEERRHDQKHKILDRIGTRENIMKNGLYPAKICSQYFAQVPPYLQRRKKQLAVAKKMRAEAALNSNSDSPFVELGDAERTQLLAQLTEKWGQINKTYMSLPMIVDTPMRIKQKTTMERELTELERDIEKLRSTSRILILKRNGDPHNNPLVSKTAAKLLYRSESGKPIAERPV